MPLIATITFDLRRRQFCLKSINWAYGYVSTCGFVKIKRIISLAFSNSCYFSINCDFPVKVDVIENGISITRFVSILLEVSVKIIFINTPVIIAYLQQNCFQLKSG